MTSCLKILDDALDRLVVSLDRPETRNAIDTEMVHELHGLCAQLEAHPRILILTGTTVNGKGIFVSGANIAQLRERTRDDALRGINSSLFQRIAALPMPVITAIDGYALGGGLELALASDFRVASRYAKFGQPETGLGIVAAAGGLFRLKEAVGETLAREMLLAGRTLNADEAKSAGLISQVTDPSSLLNEAQRLADDIAKADPLAVRLSKQLLALPAAAHPSVDNLAQAITFESEAKHARMDAFLKRRQTKSK